MVSQFSQLSMAWDDEVYLPHEILHSAYYP